MEFMAFEKLEFTTYLALNDSVESEEQVLIF